MKKNSHNFEQQCCTHKEPTFSQHYNISHNNLTTLASPHDVVQPHIIIFYRVIIDILEFADIGAQVGRKSSKKTYQILEMNSVDPM